MPRDLEQALEWYRRGAANPEGLAAWRQESAQKVALLENALSHGASPR